MDCAKSVGYSGIKYDSAKEPNSYNIVLFYPDKVKMEDFENPTLEQFKKRGYPGNRAINQNEE
jgi:hypothetical protein